VRELSPKQMTCMRGVCATGDAGASREEIVSSDMITRLALDMGCQPLGDSIRLRDLAMEVERQPREATATGTDRDEKRETRDERRKRRDKRGEKRDERRETREERREKRDEGNLTLIPRCISFSI
jgi:hypothetical protein